MSHDHNADAFVLGLLEEEEMTRAEAALATDPDWARAVARARDRFLPLDLAVQPLAVSPDLWDRVAPRLTGTPRPAAPGPAANLPFAPFLRRVLPAGLAAAIALCVGLYAGRSLQPDPKVLAVLMDNAGVARAVVEDYGSESARIRFVSDVQVPNGQQMQVWTLPSPETGPVSIGLLQADQAEALHPPSLPEPAQGQLYEITFEPIGGSPTGRPTGQILAKGLAAAQRGA